jgi:transcriptional regulator with XRE-family HTH domain
MDFFERDIFIQRLRDAVAKTGKNHEEVSEEAGLSRRAIYNIIENCKIGPRLDVLFQLSQRLGVSADYLLGLSDNPERK